MLSLEQLAEAKEKIASFVKFRQQNFEEENHIPDKNGRKRKNINSSKKVDKMKSKKPIHTKEILPEIPQEKKSKAVPKPTTKEWNIIGEKKRLKNQQTVQLYARLQNERIGRKHPEDRYVTKGISKESSKKINVTSQLTELIEILGEAEKRQ